MKHPYGKRRFYIEFREGVLCVIDTETDAIVIRCLQGYQEARAHCNGLNYRE